LNLVDLHTHTTESDGTLTPEELVRAAFESGLRTLAITDHDTMEGHAPALAAAKAHGIDLIRGIELTSKHTSGNVHLLGYFFDVVPGGDFDAWLDHVLESRRDRNRRLAARLRELGLDITVEEAERYGRRLTGRPHFARVLVAKGYVRSIRDAFDHYIGETGDAYIERESPGVAEAIGRIIAAGGIPSLAHPFRLVVRDRAEEQATIAQFAAAGLGAIEAFHPDHDEAATLHYQDLAARFGLAVSGGSDFHGANKPGVELGRGVNGNLRVPEWVVPALRARSR
jgi:predicted metal-dependent phosphoesterase TrpH